MKAALLLLAVIAVSACVNLPFFQGKVGFGPSSVTEENPDMLFDVTAVQPEVKAGRTLTIEYLVQNKHEIFDMEKVNLNVYDLCLMGGKGGIFTDLTLKPNRTKSTSEKYSVGSTDFEKSCEIKFRGSYKGHFEASQDVAVLTQAEYDLRSQRGTLGEINPLSSASRNAVTMTISFLESQPYVDGDKVRMYIDYRNNADGIIDKLSSMKSFSSWKCNLSDPNFADCELQIKDKLSFVLLHIDMGCTNCIPKRTIVYFYDDSGKEILQQAYQSPKTVDTYRIKFPEASVDKIRVLILYDHLQGYFNKDKSKLYNSGAGVYFIASNNIEGTCTDYDKLSNYFILRRDLKFTAGSAPQTTCNFIAKASQPVDSKTISFFMNYDYAMDGSIIAKVLPK